MTFNATLNTENKIATIALSGELDASTAPVFKHKIEEAVERSPQKLVLNLENLTYMSSAGLRVLIFAKQKMGAAVDLYLVNPQDMVKETILKTGFDQSVYMLNEPV